MTKVKFWFKQAGYCLSNENHALNGGQKRKIRFPATFAVLQHPVAGWILFDTGYTDRFFKETARFPASVYARLTPVTIPKEEEAVAIVQEMGIAPEEIEHIIISHFHADHIAGLRDFPNARFYCSQAAWGQMEKLKGFAAKRRALLHGLLPDDMAERVVLVDNGTFYTRQDPHLGPLWDLLGDGSMQLAYLPGHAAGQLGVILDTEEGKYFLIADACWLKETLVQGTLPTQMVKLFFDSWDEFKQSLQKVQNYARAHPETLVVPCHCEATKNELMARQEA
jgi:glyoxylase-like metal-dependent hydrolase (beta-lactamase superfamily II)